MAENKTQPTDKSIDDFLKNVSQQKRQDSYVLLDMMREISGQDAVLWGDSIIGFGSVHYKYASGREGDMPTIGFSPRKSSMTVYIADGFSFYGDLLAKLGKHKTSVSCLYINQLQDIDIDVLKEIVKQSFDTVSKMYR